MTAGRRTSHQLLRGWLTLALLPALLATTSVGTLAAGNDTKTSVLKAEGGLFGAAESPASGFMATSSLPLKDGQAFGWQITLRNPPRNVRVREELTLPSEPKTWGDPEPGIKRKTTPDGRAAITELQLQPVNGVISQSWMVTTGDPKGRWVIKVRVEDGPEHVFVFNAR